MTRVLDITTILHYAGALLWLDAVTLQLGAALAPDSPLGRIPRWVVMLTAWLGAAMLLGSGLASLPQVFPDARHLFITERGWLLLAKMFVVSIAISMQTLNTAYLFPKGQLLAPGGEVASEEEAAARQAFRRFAVVISGVLVGNLVLAAAIGILGARFLVS